MKCLVPKEFVQYQVNETPFTNVCNQTYYSTTNSVQEKARISAEQYTVLYTE